MEHRVEILQITFVTHDVKRFVTTRPEGLRWKPGQGVEVAIAEEGWQDEGRPFTPTCLADDPVMELTVKEYPDRDGVTERLHRLRPGDELLMSEPFGTITYRGPGIFLAAGAGVTPFLAILRNLEEVEELDQCVLHFSNKTPADVLFEKELRWLLGDRCHLTCTEKSSPGYDDRRIDRGYLEGEVPDLERTFYLCGPPTFVDDLRSALRELGVSGDALVFEE